MVIFPDTGILTGENLLMVISYAQKQNGVNTTSLKLSPKVNNIGRKSV